MTAPTSLTDHQRLVILQEYALEVYGRWGYPGFPDARDNMLGPQPNDQGRRIPVGENARESFALVAEFAVHLAENYRSDTFNSTTAQVISDLTRVIVGDNLWNRNGWYWTSGAKGNSGFHSSFVDPDTPRDDNAAHAMGGIYLGATGNATAQNLAIASEYLLLNGQIEDARLYGAAYDLGQSLNDGNIHFLPELIDQQLGDGGQSISAFGPSEDFAVTESDRLEAAQAIVGRLFSSDRVQSRLPFVQDNASNPVTIFPPCFAEGTEVSLIDGSRRRIEDIQIGDLVAAFDELDANGLGSLRSARVARLIPGVTIEWIVLEDGTRVTPGHRYLTEHGTWTTVAELIVSGERAVAENGEFVRLRGKRLRAEDANSDAEWILPEAYISGNCVLQPRPVFGWRTYNFEVEKFHTYVAGGLRVHNDCLFANELVIGGSERLSTDGSVYSVDIEDSLTGLITTAHHSFSVDPNTGELVQNLYRRTHLPSINSFLEQDFSFSDIDNAIIPGGWSFQNNEFSKQFGDLPDGIVVVAGGPIDIPSDFPGPTMPDYDPFQAFGTTDFSDQTDWPASFQDFDSWYSLQDPNGTIVATIGHREVEAPIDPPPDADPNTPPQLGVTSQYFVREANQTQGDSGFNFNDALYVGGQEAFGGVGDENGGYTGLITPTTPPDVSGSDSSDTIGGGEGNDTLNDGPRLVVGKQNDDAQLEGWEATVYENRPLVSGAALGKIFGASLSTLIPTDNVFADIAVSSALQTSLGAVGATFDVVTGYDPINGQQTGISLFDVNGNLNQNFVSNLGLNFASNAVSSGIGLASGLLANGLADAIGLDDNDFGSALFKTAASSTINYGLKQVAGTALSAAGFSELGGIVAAPSSNFVAGVPFDPGGLVNGIGVNIATMVGTRLANEIVEVKNVGGAIGSSIGSAVGATAGMIAVTAQVASQVVAAIGSTVATFLLPGVGAFIGTALGTLIGNWVGNLFPDEGWGEGTIIIYGGTNRFVEAAYRGNDMDFMRPVRDRMIRTRAIMNELMKAAGGTARRVGITFHNSRVGSDKFSRTEIRGAGAPERRLRSFNSKRLVDEAVTNAARRLDIQGGNAFIAFQLDRNNATTVERLLLQVKWASVWSNLAQMFYSTNNQGPDGADLVDSGVNRLLLAFNPRNFNDAVGTDNDAVWRTAREFGRTLNDETSGVSTRNKDILGINIVRALLTTEVRHMEQLQAQMVAATVFQKNLESVLGNTGGSVAAIPLADLNVGGLFRQTDANGNYTETEDEYDERIRNWGARLTREALQANPDVMLDYSPAAKAAILQATTNSQEGFTRLIAVATYFERLMTSILAPAQNAEPGVTDSAFLAGTFSYDQPDFSTVNADALGRIDDEDDALTAITEEAVRLVKATFEGGLRNADGALIRSHVAIRATDGDDIVRRAIVGFSTDRMDRFEVGLRVATSFSPAFAAMRDRLANVGIEFNSFDLPDLSALTIVEDDTLDPAASDYEDQVAANETEQIIAFVERSVVQALSSGDFAVTDGLSSAVRNSTAVTIGAFDEQVWVAHQFEGIVEAMARLGIDRDSIEIPDFNTAVVNVAAPGENSTEEEQAAYAEAVKVAARDLVGAVQTGATGQAEAVSAFDSHRDVFVELALTTQLRVASVLQYLTHEEKLEIVDNKLQRKAERNGEAISLGTIDFSTVDLTPVVSAPDQGSADLALAEIAERLAFQALRGAQVQDGDPYELSALYSPTVTNYGELIAAIVAGSDLSLYSDNRSIFDAVQILNPDSALTAGWALSAEAGFIHGIRVADFSEFDRGVAKRLVSLEKAAPLADLSVEVRNNGLAIVRDSGSGNPIVLPEITDEAELVEIASDPAAPVTGTGANDLWIAGDGGETFTDATTLADGEASHDVLLGGSGNDAINAGLGNDYVSGGLGNDQLSGGAGDDVLEGGAGDDTLNGGAGNDSYVFSQGFGNDTIQNQDASTETTDTVAFGSGIAADQLWFERLDNDLTVSDLTSNGTITLEDWYVDPAAQVDVFQLADGATLAAGDIEQLISAMAAFNPADFGAAAGSSQQPLPDDVRVAVNTTWQTTG